ncbi:MAG: hypothetical protein JRN26_04370 [Nitrososphaerota archaeon]|jgi:regulator of replication initiation timing|nr:hypothetical protein [Nitrososphaerota archaeon]MDG6932530.1 hypothetical protein [Nitrososphaerota archaeon]MDG6936099.1 hypothetical protein [Nitrososphaerota archaeon]MDG6944535.1 hypothetical protein [Nitrososphaerota archaeon]
MPDYGRVFEEVMEQRMQELQKKFESKLYFEEHADEINAEIERRANEKIEPIMREYERLKLENADLAARVKELESENKKLNSLLAKSESYHKFSFIYTSNRESEVE